MMDNRRYEKIADKALDLFSDHRLHINEIQFVAMYAVQFAGSNDILDKLDEFGRQLIKHRERKEADDRYIQHTLF